MNTNFMGSSVEKMMSRMFRKVDTVVWDLMSGKIGVRTPDGDIATFEGEGDDASISINPFEDFGVPLPAFAQSTALDSVKVGDLIYTSGKSPKWVTEVVVKPLDGSKRFKTIDSGGTTSNWNPPKVQMFGLDGGVLVVRSLVSMLPNGSEGLTGLQGSLMPLLMLGGDNMDIEKLLPFMLMSGANPAVGGGMMQAMMMMKLLGGDKGGPSKTPFRG